MTEKTVRNRKKPNDEGVTRKRNTARKRKEKILIIDDEPSFVESCRRTMEAKTYNVVTTSDREHAIEMMESEPDVIILGTLSPAGQTFSMYKWLENHPRYATPEDRAKNSEELVDIIENIFRQKNYAEWVEMLSKTIES